eukprot:scaffold20893_cov86-Cyclotella_meneghiniana.AAC.1
MMTAPGKFALGLGLGLDVLSAARVKLKSRPLLRNSGQKVLMMGTVMVDGTLRFVQRHHCGSAREALRADLRL